MKVKQVYSFEVTDLLLKGREVFFVDWFEGRIVDLALCIVSELGEYISRIEEWEDNHSDLIACYILEKEEK